MSARVKPSELTVEHIVDAITSTMPDERWTDFDDATRHKCHSASLALVRSGLLGDSRVARGSCRGVPGQHSWAVVGRDCYDDTAQIVDITLWSYDDTMPRVWIGRIDNGLHVPHGYGNIMAWGCPESGGGEEIALDWPEKPSDLARFWQGEMFRSNAGTLDRRFWMTLASNAPVQGWPAAEFFVAMNNTPELSALVPIDRLGMVTDINPEGLYW